VVEIRKIERKGCQRWERLWLLGGCLVRETELRDLPREWRLRILAYMESKGAGDARSAERR
jgi:hypothetical protein